MCLQPGILPNGQEIACRKCWQCLETRIEDWVGRCLAESKTATATYSTTLTYGRDDDDNVDHLRAAWLTYSDVQKYFKLLRRAGYRFRYLIAGEYGEQKGRCHWHAIMFFYGAVPPHELTTGQIGRRFNDDFWPHGHQIWKEADEKSIRYVCKYINKDVAKDERQAMLRMSKKPPLGDGFFRRMAMRYVEQGLAPQNLKYRFPGVKRKDGRAKDFVMRGTTAVNFLEEYKALWLRHKGGHHPNSELIETHDDRLARGGPVPDEWAPNPKPLSLRPLDGGTEIVARIRDGKHYSTCEAKGYRWWYTQVDEEWSWQKGEKLPDSDPYWKAVEREKQDKLQMVRDQSAYLPPNSHLRQYLASKYGEHPDPYRAQRQRERAQQSTPKTRLDHEPPF